MYYLGMRSSSLYLDRLASVRNSGISADIITVAGGSAFLHAISASTTSLTVVDTDREGLVHWAMIRALIAEASSLTDFLTLLGGRASTGSFEAGSVVFGPKVNLNRRLASALSAEERAAYRKTYGAFTVDALGVGRHGDLTVRFVGGINLHRDTFNWQFGYGNLANESQFQVLRSKLAELPFRIRRAPLQSLDYDADYPATGRMRFCLASNCESPMFTPADAIFLRVLETARRPVRFLSWHRDVVVAARGVVSNGHAVEPTAIVPARTVVFPDDRNDVRDLGLPFKRTIQGVDELRGKQSEYGCKSQLLMLGHAPTTVSAVLAEVAPSFKHVLWVPSADGPRSLDFSLHNYRTESTIAFADRPAWRFSLVGYLDGTGTEARRETGPTQ